MSLKVEDNQIVSCSCMRGEVVKLHKGIITKIYQGYRKYEIISEQDLASAECAVSLLKEDFEKRAQTIELINTRILSAQILKALTLDVQEMRGTLVAYNRDKITKVYRKFEMNTISEEDLETAQVALTTLENVSKIMRKSKDNVGAEKFLAEVLHPLEDCVKRMNALSSRFTSQDQRNLLSFVSVPTEKYYTDPETGTVYYEPNSSQLLFFTAGFYKEGGYLGFGINKKFKLPNKGHPNCDFLYFKKNEDQIDYETKMDQTHEYTSEVSSLHEAWKSFWGRQSDSAIKARIEKQRNFMEKVVTQFERELDKWKYASVEACATEELVNFGFKRTEAIKLHVMVLFHKKING